MAQSGERKNERKTAKRSPKVRRRQTKANVGEETNMQWAADLDSREKMLDEREAEIERSGQEVATRDAQSKEIREELENREQAHDSRLRRLAEREAELVAHEKQISDREREAEAKVAEAGAVAQAKLEDRETKAQQLRQELDVKAQALDERECRLAHAEGELEQREQDLRQREMEAESGFAAKGRQARAALDREREELIQRNRQLEVDLAQARIDRFAQLETEISAETDKRREAFGEEMQQRRESMDSELRDGREALARECEKRRAEVAAGTDQLETERADLEKERHEVQSALSKRERELARREREMTAERELLAEERRDVGLQAQETAGLEIKALRQRLEQAEQDQEGLLRECAGLEGKLKKLLEADRRFGHLSLEEVMQQQQGLRTEIKRLEGELTLRPPPETKERLELALKEQTKSAAQRQRMVVELDRLKAAEVQWLLNASELENMRSLKEAAERQCDVLNTAKDKVAAEVDRLQRLHQDLYERPADVEKRIGAIKEPISEFAERARAKVDRELTELEWLSRIWDKCDESGLTFKRRLLYAFHTALKTAEWSPLTVLAGVSGTGKSELPRLYARFGGLLFVPLAVQPDWDGQHNLFGFFNSVDNRFNATNLLRALAQSQEAPDDPDYAGGFGDRLLLVLLDEMNLAHVELYFSVLLSKLELRRGQTEPTSIEIDLGAGLKPHLLPLGRNVLWTGTMNDDETTKTLSPKVLDRGNVIGFPRPVQLHRRRKLSLEPETPLLPLETWRSWQERQSPFTDAEVRPFKKALEDMSGYLEKAGRAIGHRVWQATEHYLANHPRVLAARKSNDAGELDNAMRTAFEDQLAQKVMPRMRGIENSGAAARDCLDPIAELIDTVAPGLAEDFALARKTRYGGFVWQSANYLEKSE